MDQKQISSSMRQRPHLFILGAGATKATIPNGDKNGLQSPVMDNFLEEIGLKGLLNGVELETTSHNIEAIYSELYGKKGYEDVVKRIEDGIVNHYSRMQIPDNPTLYDYLILSLRNKDCIASFNWDPLLIQAYNRVNKITKNLPQMLFLHGCVEVGLCEECGMFGPLRNKHCPICEKDFVMPKLMFPISNKNYSQNIFIKNQWNRFDNYIQKAGIITIWGYSAPESDIDAKERMFTAFSSVFRKLDSIEIIDIADENTINDKWEPFISETNYHFRQHKSLMESIIAEFPRRSMDGYVKRYIDGWWGESSLKIEECNSFDELKELFYPLLENEKIDNYDVI